MEASTTRRRGFSLGQLLGAWTLFLVAMLGLALGGVVYTIERNENEKRAAVQLDLSLALLRHELDAHVRPGRSLATTFRDLLLEQTDTATLLYTLDSLGPRLLAQTPGVERITVLHDTGLGWQAQRSGSATWMRDWDRDWRGDTLPWIKAYGEGNGNAPPGDLFQDYRSLGAFRGAVSTSRERGDGNRDGRPRLFWNTPTTPDNAAKVMTGLTFQSDTGLITVLLNLDWSGIHRWTSRLYDQHAVRYIALDAENIVLGAPTDFTRYSDAASPPGLPSFEAISGHPLLEGFRFWRTQSAPPDQAFIWKPDGAGVWMQRFQRYDIAPERTLFMGVAYDLGAANLHENALLYWIGVVSFGGAGLGLLGSLLIAWRIRRPIEAVIREGRRVDAFEAKRAFWPRTWISEARELITLFMGLREQVQEILLEAQALRSQEIAEAPKPGKAPIRPPDAFLQAMAATRRELRQAKERVEQDRQTLKTLKGEHLAITDRLEQQCHALSALITEARRPGEETFPARVAGVVHRYTGIEGVSIWLAPESGANFERRAAAGPALAVEQVAALPLQVIQDLLFSGSPSPTTSLPQAFSDVRTAAIAKHWTEAEYPNLLLTAIPPQDGDWGILCLHRADERPWSLEWHNFAVALAGLLASTLGTRHFAESPAALSLDMDGDHFFREVAESAPGLLIVLDCACKIRFLNEAGLAFYGDAVIGRPYLDGVAATMREAESKTLKDHLRGYDEPPFLSAHLRQDGMNISLWVSMAPLQDEYGDSNGLVVWAMEAKT